MFKRGDKVKYGYPPVYAVVIDNEVNDIVGLRVYPSRRIFYRHVAGVEYVSPSLDDAWFPKEVEDA